MITALIRSVTVLRLPGNETIQFNTRIKKCKLGLRPEQKIDIKSATKLDVSINIFIYFSNIRCFCFQTLYFRHLQTLNVCNIVFIGDILIEHISRTPQISPYRNG